MVLQNVEKAQIKVRMKKDNVVGMFKPTLVYRYTDVNPIVFYVSGVTLPVFEAYNDGSDSKSNIIPSTSHRTSCHWII